MLKPQYYCTPLIFLLSLIAPGVSSAQETAVILQAHIQSNADEWGLSGEDVSDIIITDEHTSSRSGIHHMYFRQGVHGLEVFGTESDAHINNQSVIAIHQNFLDRLRDRLSGQQDISHSDAIEYVAQHLGNTSEYTLDLVSADDSADQRRVYNAPALAHDQLTVRLLYFPVGKSIVLAYEVALHDMQTDKWWQVFVEASDGTILEKISWTTNCSFHHNHTDKSGCDIKHDKNAERSDIVIARPKPSKTPGSKMSGMSGSQVASMYHVFPLPFLSPLDGWTSVESDPWNAASNASPYGWHDTNGAAGAEFTITRGNNVLAQEDTNGNNGTGYSPDGGASLTFDFTFDEHDQPVDYQDFAITNLFFWNNIMHDVWYQYGFDEASGNFQSNNYGNGGSGADYVLADAQDGSGTNNANFSTPPDGSRPRMQMFEWSPRTMNIFKVDSPASIARHYGCAGAEFGPQDAIASGTVELASPVNGCSALSGFTSGNIALIDDGSCGFTSKVKNAQNAGAIAAIICNNNDNPPFEMTGTDPTITIPSVMISKLNCDTLKAHLPGITATLDVNSAVTKDSDIENGIIAHEYGHGISIRLTGGAANSSCLNNQEQMGEGWSDWFGMIMTIQEGDINIATRGMGAYITGEPLNDEGIRSYPYTTDMTQNPHTYDDIKSLSVPHGVGSVWCEMLWEMTWGLIDQHGWDPDLYNGTGGNNIAMELVIEGLKLQPCSPGFVDGRDAILLADQNLNGGANECIIWEAFAKRGLGYSANQGSTGSSLDGTEAFDMPLVCQDTMVLTKTADFQVSSGNDLTYTLEVANYKSTTLTNVTITDTLPPNTTLLPNSLSCGDLNGNIINIVIPSLASGSTQVCEFTVQTDNVSNSMLEFFDGVEAGTSNWNISSGQGNDPFETNNSNPYAGSTSWFIPNVGADNSQYITSDPLMLSQNPILVFHHSYDTELSWDGGMVEISNDGGTSWNDLGSDFIQNGYNGVLGNSSNNDIDNRAAFTGNSTGYIETIVDLSAYSNQTVQIRFFFGSDNNTFDTGWYIDNIMLLDANYINNTALVTTAQGDSASASASTLVKTQCNNAPIIVYTDNDTDEYGQSGTAKTVCDLPTGFALNDQDCDDTNVTVNPGAMEICDGLDNNCDGVVDEGCSVAICDGDTIVVTVLNDTEFYASQHISADVVIPSGNDILFVSGNDIDLESGFEVELGASFEALIDNCQVLTLWQIPDTNSAVGQPESQGQTTERVFIYNDDNDLVHSTYVNAATDITKLVKEQLELPGGNYRLQLFNEGQTQNFSVIK